MKTLLTICALVLCTSYALRAQDKPTPSAPGVTSTVVSAEEAFKWYDANADGFITREEFLAKPRNPKTPKPVWERIVDNFMRKDKDGDGKLTLEEWKTPVAPSKSK